MSTLDQTGINNNRAKGQTEVSNDAAKIWITVLAVLGIVAIRAFDGKVLLSWTEIALFAIGVLPWFSSFLESLKFGKEGFEAVFKKELEKAKEEIKADVKEKTEKIAEETTTQINEAAAKTNANIESVKTNTEINQAITAFGSGGSSNISINDYKAELVEKAEYPNDPQKGKFGGSPIDEKKHRKLSVVVEEIPNNDYFRRLIVKIESTEPQQFPLDKDVTFHLHPSFAKPVITVKPENNKAEIKLVAWGAFTVGAETDNGETRLEFDISKENEGNNDPFYFK